MRVRWKTWGYLISACIVIAVLCQLYAEKYLVGLSGLGELGLLSESRLDRSQRVTDDGWHQGLSRPAMHYCFLPWPMRRKAVPKPIWAMDVAELQGVDAETIMGLALLRPPRSSEEWIVALFRRGPDEEVAAYYFKLADLALSRCQDEATREKLRRFSLLTEIHWGPDLFASYRWPGRAGSPSTSGLVSTRPAASCPASQPSGAAAWEFMESQAATIDPGNSLHVYNQALRLAQKLIRLDRDPRAGEIREVRPDVVLVDEPELTAAARRLDGLLTRAERVYLPTVLVAGEETHREGNDVLLAGEAAGRDHTTQSCIEE